MRAYRADAFEIARQQAAPARASAPPARRPGPPRLVVEPAVPRWIREWSALERLIRQLRMELTR